MDEQMTWIIICMMTAFFGFVYAAIKHEEKKTETSRFFVGMLSSVWIGLCVMLFFLTQV